MNPIIVLIGICTGGAVVLTKMLLDSYKTDRFKYDTVTDLRLKRKAYNDKNYKSGNGSYKTGGNGKGI